MLEFLLAPALTFAGLAVALVAGVFLTFSDFVMRSLAGSAPAAGAEAMQHINREVFGSVFMVLLMGSGIAALGIAGLGVVQGGAPGRWMVVGGALYVAGVMAVTVLRNVPMNERLARMDHRTDVAQDYWRHYARDWTRWNHVRSVASLAAAASYLQAGLSL